MNGYGNQLPFANFQLHNNTALSLSTPFDGLHGRAGTATGAPHTDKQQQGFQSNPFSLAEMGELPCCLVHLHDGWGKNRS